MKAFFLLKILIFLHTVIYTQIAPEKYFIQFTDKHNSPYSIATPSSFLTQRAIDRRQNQALLIDSTDIPVNQAYVDAVLSTGVVALLNRSRWLNGISIQTLDTAALNTISNLPFVSDIKSIKRKENYHFNNSYYTKLPKQDKKDLPLHVKKGINSYDYGFAYNQIEMIGVDFLHNNGYDGEGLVIAVIDAGFFKADSLVVFDSLRTNGQILGAKDFVNHGANVYESHPHGMMVLSVMGANVPGQIVGASPKSSYWLLRSEDAATEYIIEEYNWVSAAEFADSVGADIINSSLGYSLYDDPAQSHTFADLDGQTTVVTKGANFAAQKGILVVNSAGNSAQTQWQRIIAPADAFGALSVGSVDYDHNYSAFSSVGPSADGRVKPDVAAQGEGTIIANTQNGIMSGNGTSFSAPLIAGAAACLWQANPNATNLQLMQAIRQSAHRFNNPDSLMGYGIPNFAAAHIILSGVSIENNSGANSINVYPNPFDNTINIIYLSGDTHNVNIELLDVSGRLHYSLDNAKVNMGYNAYIITDTGGLSGGIYILKLSSSKTSITRKLVKTY